MTSHCEVISQVISGSEEPGWRIALFPSSYSPFKPAHSGLTTHLCPVWRTTAAAQLRSLSGRLFHPGFSAPDQPFSIDGSYGDSFAWVPRRIGLHRVKSLVKSVVTVL